MEKSRKIAMGGGGVCSAIVFIFNSYSLLGHVSIMINWKLETGFNFLT